MSGECVKYIRVKVGSRGGGVEIAENGHWTIGRVSGRRGEGFLLDPGSIDDNVGAVDELHWPGDRFPALINVRVIHMRTLIYIYIYVNSHIL